MKKLLLIVSFFSFLTTNQAQVCQPDMAFADSTAGVYPIPNEIVCANQFFELVLTVVVTDSITVPGLGTVKLDSVEVVEINGLPTGISTECNPGDCLFVANSMGCAIASGVPTGALGSYPLSINVNVYINGGSLALPFAFPTADDPNADLYALELVAEDDPNCIQNSTNDWLNENVSFEAMPNPTTGYTQIALDSKLTGDMQFTVANLMGQQVFMNQIQLFEGTNNFNFDATDLPNGLYVMSVSMNNQTISKKLFVSK